MKKYLTKKRIVFVSVIVLLIVIAGLYNTYAMGVYVDTTTPIEHDMALSFELSSSINEVTSVEAGKSKILEVKVTNNNRDAVQYAVTYQMVNPTTMPENFTIGQYTGSTHAPSGTVEKGESAVVSIEMTNNTASTVNVKFNVVNGYKNGGDLIIPDGEEIIPGLGAPSEVTLKRLGLIARTETPDFAYSSCSSGCDNTLVGVFAAEDDLGTSYYFRGNVTNNYVKFGKDETGYGSDLYWRIVRINGDGTIRMIYDGYEGARAYPSIISNYEYMQNDISNISYDNSSVKNSIDDWYSVVFSDSIYEDYIMDAIYCNDTEELSIESGVTFYGLGDFLYMSGEESERGVTLKCKQIDDRYSRYITVGDVGANGLLSNPIGLLTADEIIMAGVGYNGSNNSTYLSTNDPFWTMTPSMTGNDYAEWLSMFVYNGGSLSGSNVYADVNTDGNGFHSVRPVITIRGDSFIGGNGGSATPFVVE